MATMTKLRERAEKKKLASMQRHVLVCSGGDCNDGKKVVKAIRKHSARAGIRADVTATRTSCLGICKQGVIVVVYPEGTWYADVDEDVAERLVAEHLVGGRVVEEHRFLTNTLCASALVGCESG